MKGAPAGEAAPLEETLVSSLVATTFGLLASRAENDEGLHRRLEWTVAYADQFVGAFEKTLPGRWGVQARTFCTIGLFARTFRGWNEVLGIEPRSAPVPGHASLDRASGTAVATEPP